MPSKSSSKKDPIVGINRVGEVIVYPHTKQPGPKRRSPGAQRAHEARLARREAQRAADHKDRAEFTDQVDAIHTKVQQAIQASEEAKAPRQITGKRKPPRTKATPTKVAVKTSGDVEVGSGMVTLA